MTSQVHDNLRGLQLKVLEISKYFVEFCTKHNLTCYFCGGGCIGAIRHQGFIPWDDDLDFFMPREDYERLKKLWNQEEHGQYHLIFPTKDYHDHNIFMTLRDSQTTMIKPYQEKLDIVHGIAVDIFPLDGCPTGSWARRKQLFWALIFQIYGAQMVPTNHGKLVEAVGRLMLGVVPSKKARYKIWSYAEKKMTQHKIESCDYITELCAGPKYMRKEYKKEDFTHAIFTDFEHTVMPIPVGYDDYLRTAFGDYMVLPPVEQQAPSHDAVKIELETPYERFKGKLYCKE